MKRRKQNLARNKQTCHDEPNMQTTANMCATAAISEVFIDLYTALANFKMADIENLLTSGISCYTNTKDPKEIKR